MNTTTLLSVVSSIVSALSLTSCVVDVPVPMGQQGRVYQQNPGNFNPNNGYYNGGGYGRPYGRPTTPPNNYGDVAGSRVVGFPPPGGYDPNFNYGMGGYRQR